MGCSRVMILTGLAFLLACFTNCHAEACTTGWFGENCQYKCHCADNSCQPSGECVRCNDGWFGPACQYVDLTYDSYGDNSSWLYDGKDDSCNSDVTLQTVTVTLNDSYPFTWLRIHVNNAAILQKFSTQFTAVDNSVLDCNNMKNATVDSKTLDIHCDLKKRIRQLILNGDGVKGLCSVYISGGRNVALRQNASQTSTFEGFSSRALNAVDGDANPDYFGGHCTQTLFNGSDHKPTWNVTFSQSQTVNRFTLYNRNVEQQRLMGFILRCFAENMNEPVCEYKDDKNSPEDVYTVLNVSSVVPLSCVSIEATHIETSFGSPILTLCEVEIYGDSVCQFGYYGRECEHSCNCAVSSETCFVSTGGCSSGCAAGFYGENCGLQCDKGTYGKDCSKQCSEHCNSNRTGPNESPCDHIDGICVDGCQTGYQEPMCVTQASSGGQSTTDDGLVTGLGVGIGLTLAVLVAGAIGLSIYCYRRRRETNRSKRITPPGYEDVNPPRQNEPNYNATYKSADNYDLPHGEISDPAMLNQQEDVKYVNADVGHYEMIFEEELRGDPDGHTGEVKDNAGYVNCSQN